MKSDTETYYLAESNDGSQKCGTFEEARDWLGLDEFYTHPEEGDQMSFKISRVTKQKLAAGGEYADD